MKIMIIVHSLTGTTMKFASKIEGKLKEAGHGVELVHIETDVPVESGTVRGCKEFKITNTFDIKGYDVIMFGGPVWGFNASPVIVAAIRGLGDLKGKKVLPFVTMGFAFKFLGGNGAVRTMGRIAAGQGAVILPGAVVCKMFHNIEKDMEKAAETVAGALRQL